MGYRAKLGRIAKTEREKYRNKTAKEVDAMFEGKSGCSPCYPEGHEELYELGKYVDLKGDAEPFYDFDIEKEMETEFHIVSKEGLKNIIEEYRKIIHDYYSNLEPENFERHILNMRREWSDKHIKPYYLDEERTDGFIVASWKYEYAIFNIVYIYKTFDWENDYLIYSAW